MFTPCVECAGIVIFVEPKEIHGSISWVNPVMSISIGTGSIREVLTFCIQPTKMMPSQSISHGFPTLTSTCGEAYA